MVPERVVSIALRRYTASSEIVEKNSAKAVWLRSALGMNLWSLRLLLHAL
jgi:hypothetical protein